MSSLSLGRSATRIRCSHVYTLPGGYRAESRRVLQRIKPPRGLGGVSRVSRASRFRLRPADPHFHARGGGIVDFLLTEFQHLPSLPIVRSGEVWSETSHGGGVKAPDPCGARGVLPLLSVAGFEATRSRVLELPPRKACRPGLSAKHSPAGG